MSGSRKWKEKVADVVLLFLAVLTQKRSNVNMDF